MENKTPRKILIFGGDGFIGSHLRDAHLDRGDEVTVIDKNEIRHKGHRKCKVYKCELTKNNIGNFISLIHDKDFIYNCIAVATPDFYVKYPIETFELDFELNYEILKTIHKYKIPYIHFSTCEVYGKYQLSDKYSEKISPLIMGPSHKVRWIYATSKILLEQLILSHHKRGDCEAVIVRPFNFIGHDIDWIPCIDGEQDWSPRVYSCFLSALLSNLPMFVVEPGTQTRSYCYIDDAVEALLSITDNFDNCKGKVINIGNPENETTIIRLAKLMRSMYGLFGKKQYTSKIIKISGDSFYGPGYEDSEKRVPDISLIKNLTGWEPKMSLYDTLKLSMMKSIKMFT